jgi:hypothetical protein
VVTSVKGGGVGMWTSARNGAVVGMLVAIVVLGMGVILRLVRAPASVWLAIGPWVQFLFPASFWGMLKTGEPWYSQLVLDAMSVIANGVLYGVVGLLVWCVWVIWKRIAR